MDDCISRQAAIRIASGYCHPANVAKELAKLPPVQPEPKWIPVSEKAYPTEEGKYLVTDDAGGMATVEVDDFIYCDDGSGMWLCSQNVTAWKRVPKPYREEGEQE